MFSCKGCGIMLPASEFRVHKRGYRIGKCRGCERAYMRLNYAQNGDVMRKRKRAGMARKRAADPEAARAYRNAYHAANREVQTAKMRAYSGRRFFWTKAMKLRDADRATAAEIAAIWKTQRGRCALTGRKLDRTAQLDHKLPRARGGGDNPANLQWLCEAANLAKRAMTDAEFIALCAEVVSMTPPLAHLNTIAQGEVNP